MSSVHYEDFHQVGSVKLFEIIDFIVSYVSA